jgi:hypothetical protein
MPERKTLSLVHAKKAPRLPRRASARHQPSFHDRSGKGNTKASVRGSAHRVARKNGV